MKFSMIYRALLTLQSILIIPIADAQSATITASSPIKVFESFEKPSPVTQDHTNTTDAMFSSSTHRPVGTVFITRALNPADSAQTVLMTQATPASSSVAASIPRNSEPSKAEVVVGVVAGAGALAGLIGVLILIKTQKERQDIAEEQRQQAAACSIVNANKSALLSSNTDQRLNPHAYSITRESVGSIADEKDFSRRTLQV